MKTPDHIDPTSFELLSHRPNHLESPHHIDRRALKRHLHTFLSITTFAIYFIPELRGDFLSQKIKNTIHWLSHNLRNKEPSWELVTTSVIIFGFSIPLSIYMSEIMKFRIYDRHLIFYVPFFLPLLYKLTCIFRRIRQQGVRNTVRNTNEATNHTNSDRGKSWMQRFVFFTYILGLVLHIIGSIATLYLTFLFSSHSYKLGMGAMLILFPLIVHAGGIFCTWVPLVLSRDLFKSKHYKRALLISVIALSLMIHISTHLR